MDTEHSSGETRTLYRSESNRILGGVAAGLGEYFRIDPLLIRIIFVVLALHGGFGLILYLIMWLIIPSRSTANMADRDRIKTSSAEIKDKAQELSNTLREQSYSDSGRTLWGAILIVIGIFFLLGNLGFLFMFSLVKLWPLILLALGIGILIRR